MPGGDAELDRVLQGFAETIRSRNGEQLSRCLSALQRPRVWMLSPAAVAFVRQLLDAGKLTEAAGAYGVGDRWGAMIAEQIGAAVMIDAGEHASAHAHCVAGYNALLNQLRDESAWVLPVLLRLTCDVRSSALSHVHTSQSNLFRHAAIDRHG